MLGPDLFYGVCQCGSQVDDRAAVRQCLRQLQKGREHISGQISHTQLPWSLRDYLLLGGVLLTECAALARNLQLKVSSGGFSFQSLPNRFQFSQTFSTLHRIAFGLQKTVYEQRSAVAWHILEV